MPHDHVKTQLFSLVGRRVILSWHVCQHGIILKQLGPALFSVQPDKQMPLILRRGDFILPPLPHDERRAYWLSGDSEGFAYGPEFINPFAKLDKS
jgi:hypothetical protein